MFSKLKLFNGVLFIVSHIGHLMDFKLGQKWTDVCPVFFGGLLYGNRSVNV